MSFNDYFLYTNCTHSFTRQEAAQYKLSAEQAIYKNWEPKKARQQTIEKLTCGLSSLFTRSIIGKQALDLRVAEYRKHAGTMHRAATVIQRAYIRHLHRNHSQVAAVAQKHTSFTVATDTVKKRLQLVTTWARDRSINFSDGHSGQIIWQRVTRLGADLKKAGYYVFYRAHSLPIALHLELASSLHSAHQSPQFRALKPPEAQRKFRAPGVAEHFENVTAYFHSDVGRAINSGNQSDDQNRKSIISCDALEENKDVYESCQHFFKTNQSIMNDPNPKNNSYIDSDDFDMSFIQRYIKNPSFQNYAGALFSEARQRVQALGGYGMVRVIAIAKRTLENEKTNYVWRAHPYGAVCGHMYSPGLPGHAEYVATLQRHQAGKFSRCKSDEPGKPDRFPQYRILAANLDKDPSKRIFTMDCLPERQRESFGAILNDLRAKLENIIRLENISESKSYTAMHIALSGIDTQARSRDYSEGLFQLLHNNKELINTQIDKLRRDLPPNVVDDFVGISI